MEFRQTKFTKRAFRHDPDIVKLVKNLDETGAHVMATESPSYQPAVEKGKFGNIPIAFLTLRWVNRTVDSDGKEILYHEVDDKRQFNPNNYTYEDIRATFARSFDAMQQQYDELCEQIGIQGDIRQPSLEEFENYCQQIERFLKEKLG